MSRITMEHDEEQKERLANATQNHFIINVFLVIHTSENFQYKFCVTSWMLWPGMVGCSRIWNAEEENIIFWKGIIAN